jgi:hypothetical protein
MNNKTPTLWFSFTEATTGREMKVTMTFEQWDALVVHMEQVMADYYKDKGLRKDLR